MARRVVERKERKTFSLSREAVTYLESRREQERKSASEVLEELIGARRLSAEPERISRDIVHYYDSLSRDEQEENRAWGELGESQFPGE